MLVRFNQEKKEGVSTQVKKNEMIVTAAEPKICRRKAMVKMALWGALFGAGCYLRPEKKVTVLPSSDYKEFYSKYKKLEEELKVNYSKDYYSSLEAFIGEVKNTYSRYHDNLNLYFNVNQIEGSEFVPQQLHPYIFLFSELKKRMSPLTPQEKNIVAGAYLISAAFATGKYDCNIASYIFNIVSKALNFDLELSCVKTPGHLHLRTGDIQGKTYDIDITHNTIAESQTHIRSLRKSKLKEEPSTLWHEKLGFTEAEFLSSYARSIGDYFVIKKDLDKANKAYTKALELDPKNFYAYVNRSMTWNNNLFLMVKDKLKASSIDTRSLTNMQHVLLIAISMAALSLVNELDSKESLEDWQLNPDKDLGAYAIKALEYFEKDNMREALKYINKSIQYDSKNESNYYIRSEIHSKMRNYGKALHDMYTAVNFCSAKKSKFECLACCIKLNIKLNKHKDALESFSEFLALWNDETIAYLFETKRAWLHLLEFLQMKRLSAGQIDDFRQKLEQVIDERNSSAV